MPNTETKTRVKIVEVLGLTPSFPGLDACHPSGDRWTTEKGLGFILNTIAENNNEFPANELPQPSTKSWLHRNGLIETTKKGRRAFYHLTPCGFTVLEMIKENMKIKEEFISINPPKDPLDKILSSKNAISFKNYCNGKHCIRNNEYNKKAMDLYEKYGQQNVPEWRNFQAKYFTFQANPKIVLDNGQITFFGFQQLIKQNYPKPDTYKFFNTVNKLTPTTTWREAIDILNDFAEKMFVRPNSWNFWVDVA